MFISHQSMSNNILHVNMLWYHVSSAITYNSHILYIIKIKNERYLVMLHLIIQQYCLITIVISFNISWHVGSH